MNAPRLLPKKTSLVAETATTLKQWIIDGHLHDVLPGEPRLKNILGVGRDTIRLALKHLEQEHWVTSARRGRHRQIQQEHLSARRQASAERLPVTLLSPFPVVNEVIRQELEDLQRHLTEERRQLRFLNSRVFQLKRPERELKRLVEENRSAVWLLYFATERIQRWFEEHRVPALLCGTLYEGVNLPYIATDWESAAYHTAVELLRHGHRRIAILGFKKTTPGLLKTFRVLRQALAAAKPAGELLVFEDEHSPATVARSLEAIFRLKRRPTALLMCSSNQLLTCLSWMVSRGVAVPADISLVCLPNDSWMRQLEPQICHYENNHRGFARLLRKKVMELINTGHVSRKSAVVALNYCPGKSIGPPSRWAG